MGWDWEVFEDKFGFNSYRRDFAERPPSDYAAEHVVSGYVAQPNDSAYGHKEVAKVIGKQLSAVSFSRAFVKDSLFRDSKLERFTFNGTRILATEFCNCELESAEFIGAIFLDFSLSEKKGFVTPWLWTDMKASQTSFQNSSMSHHGRCRNSTFKECCLDKWRAHARFTDTSFGKCSISQSDLSGSFNSSKFENCTFSKSKLGGSFTNTRFENCSFIDSELSGSFNGVNFENCTFFENELSGIFATCEFISCRISTSRFKGVFRNVDLSRTNLSNSSFDGPRFDQVSFAGAELPKTEWRQLILNGVNLSGCSFSGSRITNPIFQDVNLSDANMQAVVIDGGSLSNVNLDRANLNGCRIIDGRFVKCSLRQTDLTGANLSGSWFLAVDGTGVVLREVVGLGMNLQKVTFHDAIFDQADFTGTSKYRVLADPEATSSAKSW